MIPRLDPRDRSAFPDVRHALREPNGLLAFGGDLSPERLENAYRRGIFPWFSEGDPILWWSPDPRTVLFPDRMRLSRSLRKRLRRQTFKVTMDRNFGGVIRGCAAPRDALGGTWILPEMVMAYEALHRRGVAHSVEVWQDDALVGGLYGVAVGCAFFGESMFSRASDASKVALVHLCERLTRWGFGLIDCQMRTEHLVSLGAVEIPRGDLVRRLEILCRQPGPGVGTARTWDDGLEHLPLFDGSAETA
ncbi:Leucyl/phenylalanyl-tRNA--protein transferase (L/F-transferase) (Leucyltransferase) (Phenyalanyltransferase) [Thiocapsa sp. KS1]|jgi:leucyl/phenylalanyl-tRNA--protein transferase|nr:leucyl/phenylalanyl-tRNA--protein transferase [Thiocapsa sp. KS1]CRI65821.1 Leucyl/phenylalanyl-tRNA--protein transferase (L/F-transferase) (Leucyltransferase) (Phenyalanyltransferase) [Thiocapsa sp. KS1]